MSIYGTSIIKRKRRTKAEIEALDAILWEIVDQYRFVTVRQVFYQAVNREQIDRWQLPTRPTKATDTRASKFRQVHGTASVELDSIPPDTLRQLVREAVESHMDPWELQQLKMAEKNERDALKYLFKASYSSLHCY